MHLRLTSEIIVFLHKSKLIFTESGAMRFAEGEVINFSDDLRAEAYAAVFSGHSLASIGSFSYSFSPLPEDLQIGRYFSISWILTVMHGNHPL